MKSNRRRRRNRRQEQAPKRPRILMGTLATLLVLILGTAIIAITVLMGRIDFIKGTNHWDAVELQALQDSYARVLDQEGGDDSEEIALAEALLNNQLAVTPAEYYQSDDVEHILLRFSDPQNLRGGTNRDLFYLMTYIKSTERMALIYLPNALYLKGPEISADHLQAYANYAGIDYVRQSLEHSFAIHIPKVMEFDISYLLQPFRNDNELSIELTEPEAKAINLQISDHLENLEVVTESQITPLPEEAGEYYPEPAQALAYWRLGEIEDAPSPLERRSYLIDTLITYYLDHGFTTMNKGISNADSLARSMKTDLNFFELIWEIPKIDNRFDSEVIYFDLLEEDNFDTFNHYGNDLLTFYPRELQQRYHDFLEANGAEPN